VTVLADHISILGIRVEFLIFAGTLFGVALLHRHALAIAAAGLAATLGWCLAFSGFAEGRGLGGLGHHLGHEWVLLANLLLLLTGFEILAQHFSASRLPVILPRLLPAGRAGAIVLLAIVFALSAFLDNIAAAVIGATIATHAFRGNVHVGYLAAIVAAANAGGAGSVVGDSTTTMIWLAGHSPLAVLHAYVGAVVAFAITAWIASGQQHRLQPLVPTVDLAGDGGAHRVDWRALGVVILVIATAIGANVGIDLLAPEASERAPWIGLAVWAALIAVSPWRGLPLAKLPHAATGAAFLLCLVLSASCMPVAGLPGATTATTAGLGLVSAVFDNIPLTALALQQGGYDWGLLAYAVGFGGSLIWFGSSAGVAVAGQHPAAQSTLAWLRHAWFLPIAYAAGVIVMVLMS
jgi:Na+/H+ antiporter NhaD/arsenite permease-like protein